VVPRTKGKKAPAKKVDVTWATEEGGLSLALSIKVFEGVKQTV